MGASVENLGKGGGESKCVRDILKGGGAGPGEVPTKDRSTDHWEASPQVILQ